MKSITTLSIIIVFTLFGIISCSKTNSNQRKLLGEWELHAYKRDSAFLSFENGKVYRKVKNELTGNQFNLISITFDENDSTTTTISNGVVNYCKLLFKGDGKCVYSFDITSFIKEPNKKTIHHKAVYEGNYDVSRDTLSIGNSVFLTGNALKIVNGDTIIINDLDYKLSHPIILQGTFYINELTRNELVYYINRTPRDPYSKGYLQTFKRFGWKKID